MGVIYDRKPALKPARHMSWSRPLACIYCCG